MRVLLGHDDAVAEWAGKRLGLRFSRPYVAIGFLDADGTLSGAAVFNGWNGSNIDVTVYGPRCMTRQTIAVVYGYVFRQLKANRLTARTARANKAMQRLLPRIGFKWEGIAPRYYGAGRKHDAIVYSLMPENAEKWMKSGIAPRKAALDVRNRSLVQSEPLGNGQTRFASGEPAFDLAR